MNYKLRDQRFINNFLVCNMLVYTCLKNEGTSHYIYSNNKIKRINIGFTFLNIGHITCRLHYHDLQMAILNIDYLHLKQ